MTGQTKIGITEEDFYGEDKWWYEVINGKWVEMDIHQKDLRDRRVISQLADILNPYVISKSKRLGEVVKNTHYPAIYFLLADENGIQNARIPDLAFKQGFKGFPHDVGLPYRPFVPTLAVIIAVPEETLATRLSRAADFLRYGTEEVWIIYPMKRELHRYQRGEEVPEIYTDWSGIRGSTVGS